jgi:hypothetical protein
MNRRWMNGPQSQRGQCADSSPFVGPVRGYLAPADPAQYAVVDGKLYLNFNAAVKAMWDLDRAGFITSGHDNWQEVPADAKFAG